MFGSDNQAPAHPAVMDAILAANEGRAGSYGDDAWSARALAAIKTTFETNDLDMYLVATGGAANGLALSLLCPPWGAVLALDNAHVLADEGGGPEHFTSGARMIGIGLGAQKLLPEHLAKAATHFAPTNVQSPQPRAVTIANLSENGLVYRPEEILALSKLCKANAWGLHMDGARFANAVVSTGASPADLTWRSGVDALSFGLTKNGAACAEILVVFGKTRGTAGAYLRKRAGHLFSKQRYLSAQVAAMLENGIWLELAAHANEMATSLSEVLAQSGGNIVSAVDGNEVFVKLTPAQIQALTEAQIGFYPWAPAGQGVYRFVTCWQTTDMDIAAVSTALSA
jgi:threonine aldolase